MIWANFTISSVHKVVAKLTTGTGGVIACFAGVLTVEAFFLIAA